ncbi:hypothetical protein [Mesorhizobium caraganae]|uniref:hypothetical protein n=1 Tax=Mesorhizobium caraganae TaxID=483206 RepID=UPI003F5084D9
MVASVTSVPPRRKYSWHSHNKLPRNAAGRGVGIYRVGLEIGSLAAALGGLDTLVFTAGIGEHAPLIRHKICEAAEAWRSARR